MRNLVRFKSLVSAFPQQAVLGCTKESLTCRGECFPHLQTVVTQEAGDGEMKAQM